MDLPSGTQQIRAIVEEACKKETNIFGYGIWTHHIVYVVQYGRLLAEQLGADAEIVELAALLHDYASIKDESLYRNHHLHGPLEAERILRELDYPEGKIHAVKQCIASHRASIDAERVTPEVVCLASADAMAHIDQVPSLLYLAFVRFGMGIDEGTAWVREKLGRYCCTRSDRRQYELSGRDQTGHRSGRNVSPGNAVGIRARSLSIR